MPLRVRRWPIPRSWGGWIWVKAGLVILALALGVYVAISPAPRCRELCHERGFETGKIHLSWEGLQGDDCNCETRTKR